MKILYFLLLCLKLQKLSYQLKLYCEINKNKSKQFLKKFKKFTSKSFRIAITWKTRNKRSLFLSKDQNDYKSWVVLVIRFILAKRNVMQRLFVMNIIMQLEL